MIIFIKNTQAMREHLYKAKSTKRGAWLYGDLVHEAIDGTSRVIPVGIQQPKHYPVEVLPETVCQFTNAENEGEKIFQGDTFKVWLEDSLETDGGYWWHCVVMQHLGCWILGQIDFDYRDTPIEHCELLLTSDYKLLPTGNIHDKTETT